VNSPTANEKGNYPLLGLPGLRGGMKYNFKNNFGIRIALSMETLQLERYEQSRLGALLPAQANIVESKMSLALAYSF
jgi:hypothetical protein